MADEGARGQVEDQTGLDLGIEGEIEIEISPSISHDQLYQLAKGGHPALAATSTAIELREGAVES